MATLSAWFGWIGPLAGFGNAGAVDNAARACEERRRIEAATDTVLARISAPIPLAALPAGESA